jgi:hypothetical protein
MVGAIAWDGSRAVTPTFTEEPMSGGGQELAYCDDEARLVLQEAGRGWPVDIDGNLLRLVSESHQISLACLFGAYLDLQGQALSSPVNKIESVCEKMLLHGILRSLLTESQRARQMIMIGLCCNEPMISGDVEHCLRAEAESLSRPAHADPKTRR